MTGTAVAVPEESIHPGITHMATRRALVGGVLSDGQGIMRFRPLSGERMVTAVHLVEEKDDPADLDPRTAGTVVIGHLLVEGDEAQAVVVDGKQAGPSACRWSLPGTPSSIRSPPRSTRWRASWRPSVNSRR